MTWALKTVSNNANEQMLEDFNKTFLHCVLSAHAALPIFRDSFQFFSHGKILEDMGKNSFCPQRCEFGMCHNFLHIYLPKTSYTDGSVSIIAFHRRNSRFQTINVKKVVRPSKFATLWTQNVFPVSSRISPCEKKWNSAIFFSTFIL